jgi:hypothetical protein
MLKIQQEGARAKGKVHAAALKKVSRQKTAATAISIAGAIPPVGRALKGAVAGAKGAYAAGKALLTRAARGHAKNQANLARKAATKTAVKKAFKKPSFEEKKAGLKQAISKIEKQNAQLRKRLAKQAKQVAENNKKLGKSTRPSDLTIPKTRAAQRDAVKDAFKNRSKPPSKGGMKKTASDANTKADRKKLGIKPGSSNKNRKKPGGSSTNPPKKGKYGNKPTPDKTNRKPSKGQSYDEEGKEWPPKKPWE